MRARARVVTSQISSFARRGLSLWSRGPVLSPKPGHRADDAGRDEDPDDVAVAMKLVVEQPDAARSQRLRRVGEQRHHSADGAVAGGSVELCEQRGSDE